MLRYLLAVIVLLRSSVGAKVARPKRVLPVNKLRGFQQDVPSLFPPGLGGDGASERLLFDIGSNDGDPYTARGYKNGHTVFSFEPSPLVGVLFRSAMRGENVNVAVVRMSDYNDKRDKRQKLKIPAGDEKVDPKVYLVPVALSNKTGEALYHESPCADLSKCGKVNRIVTETSSRKKLRVQTFRLDDLILPIGTRKAWFMKIDVEGYELEVLQGARQFIKKRKVPYIAVEFSSNGRTGTEWGVSLLEELHRQEYSCFHLRGFGKCINTEQRSPSMKCNYPFAARNASEAPTFQKYTKVFETRIGNEKNQRSMADLMCARKSVK